MMDPDDELCLCFHVTRRKVENWLRVNRPAKASQLSECFGAGTGCGWCRPFLRRLFDHSEQSRNAASDQESTNVIAELPSAEDYAKQRTEYRDKKKNEQ